MSSTTSSQGEHQLDRDFDVVEILDGQGECLEGEADTSLYVHSPWHGLINEDDKSGIA